MVSEIELPGPGRRNPSISLHVQSDYSWLTPGQPTEAQNSAGERIQRWIFTMA